MEFNLITQLGLLIRIFALFLIVVKVIPKQYQEATKYKNGLRLFRIFLLILGVATAFSIFVGMVFVVNREALNPLNISAELTSLTYSMANLALSLMLYLIYNGRDGE